MTVQEWLGDGNEIGVDIFNGKYRNNNETLDEWFDRISGGDKKLRELIVDKKFLFGGRTLSNRKLNQGSLANCYSVGFCPDDYEGILNLNTDLGMTYKAQGGQGVSLSKIRPKGTPIGDRYKSDGIIPFLELFNKTTEVTSQAGSRKGALLVSLDVRHKQVEEFIKIKSEENSINKANLSLEIDDEFMELVDEYYKIGNVATLNEKREYSGHKIDYDIVPIDIFKLLAKTSHEWAEPGVLFTEEFRNYNLMEFHDGYNIETSNPCSEQPLKPYSSCTLGSLDLSRFVKEEYSIDAYFHYGEFLDAIFTGIEALDDIVSENMMNHPLKKQREASKDFRNIGLGVFGLATALFKMGLTYGSDESKDFVDELFNFMFVNAVYASNKLAKERGKFPQYDDCIFESRIIKNHFDSDQIEKLKVDGLRNCSLLSIAPAGTIATMLGSSTSAEPEYAIVYNRKTHNLNESYDIYCNEAQYYLDKFNTTVLPDYFVCSKDINWKDRIDMQAVIQKHIDTGISSTVNLPKETTVEEVEQLYLYAWKNNIKGITIFRDGGKREGILTTDSTSKQDENYRFNHITPPSKEDLGETIGYNDKKNVACGSLYLTVAKDPATQEIVEVYINKSKSGVCEAMSQGVSRLVSTCLRSGVSVEYLCDQLIGIKCQACTSARKDGKNVELSCPHAIGSYILEKYKQGIHHIQGVQITQIEQTTQSDQNIQQKQYIQVEQHICPECGNDLAFVGGCVSCQCGYSKCS